MVPVKVAGGAGKVKDRNLAPPAPAVDLIALNAVSTHVALVESSTVL